MGHGFGSGGCGGDAMYLYGGGSGAVGAQTTADVPDGTKAAVAAKKWTDGKGGYKLTCRSSYSAEGMDRKPDEFDDKTKKHGYPKLTIDKKTIVFISAPGQVPMGELMGAGAIIYSMYPGQRAGHALADVLSGTYQPSGHLAYTLFSKTADYDPQPHDYKGPHGEDGLGLGYRAHQVSKKGAFAFGFGLPYFPEKTMKKWEDLITVEVKGLSLDVRSIYFCVTNKAKGSGKTKMADPSPVVQFYAKKTGREYMELITFRKVREVGAGKQECRIAFYDPVSVWKGGGFQDLKYPSEWKLYYSLNGVPEAKEVAKPKKFVAESKPKLYKTLNDYGRAYKERYAAEHALWKTAKEKEAKGLLLADKVSEKDLGAVVDQYLALAKRSKLQVTGQRKSPGEFGQPDAR
eukprot:g16251.t1